MDTSFCLLSALQAIALASPVQCCEEANCIIIHLHHTLLEKERAIRVNLRQPCVAFLCEPTLLCHSADWP